ncbi:MAG: TonB-dependent receptor, partial [Chitinophagia bacterium]|nr:TonB-dependent receptor [Chitinophagia bacterium]
TFLDLQFRRVNYSFKGDNAKQQDASQNVALSMFNPKAGINYKLNDGKMLYASWAVAQREPNRNDYVNAIANQLPQKELLNDFEAGFRKTKGKIQLGFNAYYMNYQNQLILTGQLNEVGDFIRTNVGSSYRAGIEMELGIQCTSWLKWNANLTLSQNKVRRFVNIVQGYNGPNDYLRQDFSKTNIAYSPNVIAANQLLVNFGNWDCAIISKYVSSQYLDNTQNRNSRLNGYTLTDIRLKYKLPYVAVGNVELGLLLNNIFNYKYVSNGYTYSDLNTDASINNYTFYYPQAGFNLLGSISLRF